MTVDTFVSKAHQDWLDHKAAGRKVYDRKHTSERCEARIHAECSGTVYTYASYVVPTRQNCPCKCHAPTATCKRCGMTGLAWAQIYVGRRGEAWKLYQGLDRPLNGTYRMGHQCGVDHNVTTAAAHTREDLLREERAWLRTERLIARAEGTEARNAALTAYSVLLADLALPGSYSFEDVVMDELPADPEIQARARALYDAGRACQEAGGRY